MAKEEVISIDKLFSKGFIRDYGTNKVPEYFAETAINVRLVNGGITVRKGSKEVYTDTGTVTPQGIVGNDSNNRLYFVYNGSVYSVDPDAGTAINLGSISSTARCRFINYGRYTIFLTGDQRPYWTKGDVTITFDAALVASNNIDMDVNGTALTQVTFNTDNDTTLDNIATQLQTDFPTLIAKAERSGTRDIIVTPVSGANITIDSIVVSGGASQANGTISWLTQVTTSELDDIVKPSFGGTFAGFTIINRTDTKNVISISRPITLTNQGYCKDWKGTDAYTISLKGDLQGMCATLSRFWLFTDKSIEYLSPSFLDSSGAYVPTTFADGEVLCSPDCVVPAGDLVFFVTKSKKIRSIGYAGTITEPQIKTITDIEGSGIQKFMEEEIAEDQSLAFGHYDRANNLVKFHFVGINSNVPDTILCWDLVTNQWLLDLDKQYSSICTLLTKQYAAAAIGQSVYEDEVGEDDDGNAIEWEYTTQSLGLGEPSVVKIWRGATVGGQIGYETLIRMQMYVDDVIKFDKYIDGSIENPFSSGGIGGNPIGGLGIGDVDVTEPLTDFEKSISLGRLRTTGKKIRFRWSGGNIGQRMVLDFLSITYKLRNRKRVKDKRFTSVS